MKKIARALVFLAFAVSACAAKIKVACVGDSITDGFGLANASQDSWPALLAYMLGEGYEVRNFGQTGKTLQKDGDQSYWDERKYAAALEFKPDIVIIKLGTNDAKEKNWNGPENFKRDLLEFVESFQSLPGAPKIYLGTSAWVRKDAIGIAGDRVDNGVVPVQREVAKLKGLDVLDFNGLLRGHPDWYCDDIHPNERGALEMAGFVYRAIAGGTPPEIPVVRGADGDFMGFRRCDYKFRGRDASLFIPSKPSKDGKWIWVPSKPASGNAVLESVYARHLKDGFYILHTDLDSWLGNPNSVKWGDFPINYYAERLGFSKGGLRILAYGVGTFYALNFAAANPGMVSEIALVNPEFEILDWAASDPRNMRQLLQEWKLKKEDLPELKDLGKINLKKAKDAGIKVSVIKSSAQK